MLIFVVETNEILISKKEFCRTYDTHLVTIIGR